MAETLMTLAELASAISGQLKAEGVEPGNGQVSARVDERTLRYYMTLGLLDRPVARRGRVAVYGERHAAQAVAVKRLQAAGWPLADIQRRLAAQPTAELRAVRADERPPVSPALEAAPLPGRGEFWAHPPVPLPQGAAVLSAVAVSGGAVILLPAGGRAPTQADAEALAAAAGPLLAEAARRGLLHVNDTHPSEGEAR